jgi:hypothetical protein
LFLNTNVEAKFTVFDKQRLRRTFDMFDSLTEFNTKFTCFMHIQWLPFFLQKFVYQKYLFLEMNADDV